MKKLILTTALTGLTLLASGVSHANNFYGTEFNDNLLGSLNGDKMYGYSGKDTLYGDGGHDSIYGGGHADKLYGGAGRDKVWGQYGNDDIDTGAPQQESHTEVQGGGPGNDTCYNADYNIGKISFRTCENKVDGSI